MKTAWHGNRRVFGVAVGLALALAVLAHFWRIGSMPAGFFCDESSITYNSWCIAETGADEYGTRSPLFFRCFDNFHEPVMVYSIAPVTKLFGPVRWAGRTASGIYHLLAAVVLSFLIYEYSHCRWTALAFGVVFALHPWVFPVSRSVMAGYTPMLLGMVLGHLLFWRALKQDDSWQAAGAGVAYAFAMYAHNIGRPMTALYVVCFGLSFMPQLLKQLRVFVTFTMAYVLALVPMIVCALSGSAAFTTRFGTLCVWGDGAPFTVVLKRISGRYVEYFNPVFLFFLGDRNLRHNTGQSGQLYLSTLPLVIAGLVWLVRTCREKPENRFVLLGLFTYPTAAALTMDHFHSTRCINGSIYWTLAAAVGVAKLARVRQGRLLLTVLALTGALEAGFYLHDYFGAYQQRSRFAYNQPVVDALERAARQLQPTDTMTVSASALENDITASFKPLAYVDLAVFLRIPPAQYQQSGGFPTDRVRAFLPFTLCRPGLLLRRTHWLRPGYAPKFPLNEEAIPSGARLIDSWEVVPGIEYQLFRVGEPPALGLKKASEGR
jgi:hypothetical protein